MSANGEKAPAALLVPERLQALRETGLLDSPPEDEFDRLTRIATRVLGVPVALVSLVDDHRQFFKSAQGLPEPWASRRETPLTHAFCKHVVIDKSPLIVTNAPEDPRVRDNGAVADLGVIAYLGIPMITEDDQALGSFCAIDTEPHDWSADEIGVMEDLCSIAMTKIELRREIEGERQERKLAVQARRRAERSDAEKSRFLANMSHEIRTPMNAIIGFSELLEGSVESPRAKHYLSAIRESGQSLLDLINDILDLSKIEAGRLELAIEPADLRETIGSIGLLFSQQAKERGLAFSTEVSDACPAYVEIDSLRVRQILLNLVSNSIKFTDRGEVMLCVDCVETGDQEITLSAVVSDTGRGIPINEQESIFDPFRQAIDSDNEITKGTGLGLSICRRLCQLMNGEITVESKIGEGSVFTLTIPGVAVSESVEKPSAGESGLRDMNLLKQSSILIVDDNDYNRDVAGGFFADSHHDIHYATDGLEALQLMEENHPDVVLMDIRMPRMDGREALFQIRANPKLADTPVLAITASTLLQEEKELREMFDGYMRKPFAGAALFNLLSAVIPAADETEARSASAAEGIAAQTPPGPEAKAAWSGTIAALRDLESRQWPALKQTMAMGEATEFAKSLSGLASEAECGPLADYAASLRDSAEHFRISDMEAQLDRFPGLISDLESLVH